MGNCTYCTYSMKSSDVNIQYRLPLCTCYRRLLCCTVLYCVRYCVLIEYYRALFTRTLRKTTFIHSFISCAVSTFLAGSSRYVSDCRNDTASSLQTPRQHGTYMMDIAFNYQNTNIHRFEWVELRWVEFGRNEIGFVGMDFLRETKRNET